jgi:hypothetical protein
MSDILPFETAFVRAARRMVDAAFEANRNNPKATDDIPFIGWMHGVVYNPHGTPEDHARLQELVVKALLAKKWFEDEVPKRLQVTLPLHETERVALNGSGDRRLGVVSNYALLLQSMHWNLARAPSFLDFYAQSMAR